MNPALADQARNTSIATERLIKRIPKSAKRFSEKMRENE
ncbi:hypothetical protein EDF68_11523 [Ochrobactrum sp. BH3]|jgi:hypothetical protein|nr:hypothetical protein EDF68_11523 [Ochrobactrum sp. BH3]